MHTNVQILCVHYLLTGPTGAVAGNIFLLWVIEGFQHQFLVLRY